MMSLCLAWLLSHTEASHGVLVAVSFALGVILLVTLITQLLERRMIAKKVQEDEMLRAVRSEALGMIAKEPWMRSFLRPMFLDFRRCQSFEDVVSWSVANRLASTKNQREGLYRKIKQAFDDKDAREYGWPLNLSARSDCQAVVYRDPATESYVEVVAYFKGFIALQAHRAARYYWYRGEKQFALWLQSRTSEICGVDAHPACEIGCGVMIDHATGVVVGETAKIGDGCTLLHGVTLGSSGKDKGDRHPKVGEHVLIGAGTSILGNIRVGDRSKIGAGSVVLKPIPSGATAVGAPARIVGRAKEAKPAEFIDNSLDNVDMHADQQDVVCVWREIARQASTKDKLDTAHIGIQAFTKALSEYQIPEGQIHDLFFQLDTDLDGLVSIQDLRSSHFQKTAPKYIGDGE